MATGAAAGFRLGEVTGVAVDVQDHVAGGVLDYGIGIGIGVVEEPEHFGIGFVGGCGLGGSN